MPPIRTSDRPPSPSGNTPEGATQSDPPRRRRELDAITRTKICTLRTTAGWTYKQIQKEFPHIPYTTLVTTVHKENKRVQNATSPRSGRPQKLDEADKAKLLEAVDKNPNISNEELLALVDHKVKRQSIWRVLKEKGKQKRFVTHPPNSTESHNIPVSSVVNKYGCNQTGFQPMVF